MKTTTTNCNLSCLFTLLVAGAALSSAFVTSSNFGSRPSATTSPKSRLEAINANQLLADIMRIEWVEEQVQELKDLESSIFGKPATSPSVKDQDDVASAALKMDYDLADAISEPKVNQAALQQKIQERLKRHKKAQKQELRQVQVERKPVHESVSLQMDYDFADAISRPKIDQAELQKRIRARLAQAKKLKAKNQPALVSKQSHTVQVVP